MQRSVAFIKQNLKINIWEIKNVVKLGIIVIIAEEYRGFAHSICKLKYSVSRNIPLLFHNGLNYGYHSSLKS